MILISHRGNYEGSNPELENDPFYINLALEKGYDCEVDVRYIDGVYYLGHDYPTYKVNLDYLNDKKLWCHAKDGTTLRQLLKEGIHCFYDSNPNMNYTLTSENYIWHWDGEHNIYVMNENGLVGICSDYVSCLKQR